MRTLFVMRVAGSILHRKATTFKGTSPYASFELNDGTVLVVTHEGSKISIRRTDDPTSLKTGLLISPVVHNEITVACNV